MSGERHHAWKGKNVGYVALHIWINNNYGKANKCEGKNCRKNSKTYDWANVSGLYKRVKSDWKELCRSCHMIFDGVNKNGVRND